MDGPGRDRDVEDAAAPAIDSGVVLVGRLAAMVLVGGGQRGTGIGGAHRRLGLLRRDGLGRGTTASGRLVNPTDGLDGVRLAPGDRVPADVGADQGAVDVDDLALGDPGRDAGLHGAGKGAPGPLRAPALPDARQAGVVRQRLVQAVAGEPADGGVGPGLAHQPPVVDDAEQQAREHQPHRGFRIDAGKPRPGGVAPGKLGTKPAEVEHAVNPHQDVVVGDQVAQRAGNDEFELTARLASQHAAASTATVHRQRIRTPRLFQQPRLAGVRRDRAASMRASADARRRSAASAVACCCMASTRESRPTLAWSSPTGCRLPAEAALAASRASRSASRRCRTAPGGRVR